MKPYIIDAYKDGRYLLHYQIEGIDRKELRGRLCDTSVVAYALPDGHTLQSSWLFRLLFANGDLLEFSSACTNVGGWQEMGSLNISFIKRDKDLTTCTFEVTEIDEFYIQSVACLVYEDPDVYVEGGIAFLGEHGRTISIVAGVSPGSVSVEAPFSELPVKGELDIGDYKYVPL